MRWTLAPAFVFGAFSGQDRLREARLAVGVELTYSSGGQAGAPWRVELAERDLAIGGRTGCVRVRFAAGGPRAGPDTRTTCETDGILFSWNSTGQVWRASRPVAPARTLETTTGASVFRYTTGSLATDTIGQFIVRVVETTMTTTDSTGRTIRRLRERFAPGLGTATWGSFERPDPAAPDGWVVEREFRLTAIVAR